jgi:hypothetical protein
MHFANVLNLRRAKRCKQGTNRIANASALRRHLTWMGVGPGFPRMQDEGLSCFVENIRGPAQLPLNYKGGGTVFPRAGYHAGLTLDLSYGAGLS